MWGYYNKFGVLKLSLLRDSFEASTFRSDVNFSSTMKNGRNSVLDSVQRRINEFEYELRSIAEDNESNGLDIKEGARKDAYYEALKPILNMAKEVKDVVDMNKGVSTQMHPTTGKFSTVVSNRGFTTVSVSKNDGSVENLELGEVDCLLSDAVNRWIDAVELDQSPELDDIGLPLSEGSLVRFSSDQAVYSITELFDNRHNGNVLHDFIPNTKDQSVRIKNSISRKF